MSLSIDSLGQSFSVVDDNEVFTWGYGLLGSSFEPCFSSTPQKLVFYAGKRVMKVECGLDYYVLVTGSEMLFSNQ
jgi:hypothetical protein